MLLQHIVDALDTELNRLNQLREIVAGLTGSAVFALPEPVAQEEEEPVAAVEPSEAAPKARKQRTAPRPAGARRGPITRRSKTPAEPTALTKVTPAAPVVVSAAALAKESERLQRRVVEKVPKPAVGSLGSMIRALELQANA